MEYMFIECKHESLHCAVINYTFISKCPCPKRLIQHCSDEVTQHCKAISLKINYRYCNFYLKDISS